MFKYIRDILTTITPGQRIVALAFLLMSITVIAVGPKIVGSFTQDTEELQIKVESQKNEIADLTQRVGDLNRQVITNQTECTNQWMSREREILGVINLIEQEALSTNGRIVATSSTVVRRPNTYNYDNDTMQRVSMMVVAPEPEVVKTVTHKVDNRKMLGMVSKLKGEIQKDLGKQ